METVVPVLTLLLGVALGGGAAWLFLKGQMERAVQLARSEAQGEVSGLQAELRSRDGLIERLEGELESARSARDAQQSRVAEMEAKVAELKAVLEKERERAQEQLKLLEEAQEKLGNAFKALSAEALRSNNESFLKLARETLAKYQESAKGDLEKRQQAIEAIVKPIEKSLSQVDAKLQAMEKERIDSYSALKENIRALAEANRELRTETKNLVTALRRPDVRGRWGEIQLKRVVEMAGMLEYCDFYQQQSVQTEEGVLRPDLLVRLPGGKTIVVDSKVPLTAFLEAIEASDEATRLQKLRDHARQVKTHIQNLSRKSYFAQFEQAPEFVVLFLPGEIFFSAALEQSPDLIEMGVEQNVIIATPTTLIALLKAVAYGWTQERLAESAREVSQLGRELHRRLSQLGDHLAKLGKNLANATRAYNSAIGSLESRVFVTARKFSELHVVGADEELKPLVPVEQSVRGLQAPELRTVDDKPTEEDP